MGEKGRTTDPLFYGTVHISKKDVPEFQSGSKILNELDALYKKNRNLDTILHAPDDVIDFFQKQFPELVQTNDIGNLREEGFNTWIPGNNDITIEVDPNPRLGRENARDVYIGGPAALFAAAIHANSKTDTNDILYGHDGNKGVSNWKGSASCFVIRETTPIYYWPDNSGVYTLYCTTKHALQKLFSPVSYKKKFQDDPHFNKLRINIKALLKDPLILPQILLKNALYLTKDVNLHLTKTHLIERTKSTAYATLEHARLTSEIIDKLDFEKPIFFSSSDESGKALNLHIGEKGVESTNNVFRNLVRIGGDAVKHTKLSKLEMMGRGFTDFVHQALDFHNDGYFAPYMDQQLEQVVLKNGGNINNSMRLKKILVEVTEGGDDCRASNILWEDVSNGQTYITPVKTLYLSLGPSVRILKVVAPKYSLSAHIFDVIKAQIPFTNSVIGKDVTYLPTMKSLLRHVTNKLTSDNLLDKTMWACGLSSTILIKVDMNKVPAFNMIKYRDHLDAHNRHCVRLAEKEAIIDGKPYRLFVLQMTGGGHFPINHIHCEAVMNILKGTWFHILNLKQEGVEFELLSARSCARSVCANNVFRVKAPLSNTVMIYGTGGIGLTTMPGNALLMKAVQQERQKLSRGDITTSEFYTRMKESDFSHIPHWKWGNPFSRNYAQFVDSVRDPRDVARKLGLRTTTTPMPDEKKHFRLVMKGFNGLRNTVSRFIR